MKILHLIQKPQNRGAETFTCQLSGHQVEMGHEVKIVSVFEGIADLPWKGDIQSLKGSSKNRLLDLPAWKRLAKIISEFKPDIVQANAGDTLKYAVGSKLVFRWKNPIVFRNASEVGRYLNSFFQKKYNGLLYKYIDGALSVSEASKRDLIENFPFLENITKVIPIGLENKVGIEILKLTPSEVGHIVHVGGFSFEKNHEGLINIFQTALKTVPNLHLHLVGDGPLRNEIEILIKEKSLQSKVTFHGFVNNPLAYIKAADALVLPSIIEGLPGVILEAMYCKTPVVAFNVGGISEILTSNTGYLIKKNNEDEFAEALGQCLLNPEKDKVENAFSMVKRDFMNDRISEKFINAYREILAKNI